MRKLNGKRLLLTIALAFFVLFSINAGDQTEESAGADLSKHVTLTMTLMGGPPIAFDAVLEEANKYFKEKLNCTLVVNWIPWTNWAAQYNLTVASGDPIDLLFAAAWTESVNNALKGGYMDLTDLLPKYAPQTWKNVTKAQWDAGTIDGNIYIVPHSFPEWLPRGFAYRTDYAKEAGLADGIVDSVAKMEQYLEGFVKNHGTPPLLSPGKDLTADLAFLFNMMYPDWRLIPYGDERWSLAVKSADQLTEVFCPMLLPEFDEFVAMMERWDQKGFWPKDVLSMNEAIEVDEGARVWQYMKFANDSFKSLTTEIYPGTADLWRFFSFSDIQNKFYNVNPIHNGMAIGRNAKNPERALMLLDLIRNDRKAYDLMAYGVEGVNWEKKADGKIGVPASYDETKDKYGISHWGWRKGTMEYKREGTYPGWDADYARFATYCIDDPFANYKFNLDNIASELAAYSEVCSTYMPPLMVGKTDQVSIEEFRQKLEEAGWKTIRDELVRQIKEQM